MSKRKAAGEPDAFDDENLCLITPLGAGQEVGRSCLIVKYRGKTVMLDCGVHPGYTGVKSLPYLDEIDLSTVDVALITHFHLDHCAAVPYLVSQTNFKGRIFMTHATKAIFYLLLKDFVKVSKSSADEQLYNEKELDACMGRIELIDFQQTLDLDGMQVTAYRAGHVLGAAMFMVEIGGMRCLYTGDYSRVQDRHLDAADLPEQKPHIVIVESTYGTSNHEPREQREKRFLDIVDSTVLKGGHVLLPIVALGRAQELLLMLEDHWRRTPDLHAIPVYQVSGLARKALSVYQTYIESLNADIRETFQMDVSKNPFNFQFVQHKNPADLLDEPGPSVVMATPSMLQSGLSRELFDQWCDNARNTVIIADFAVAGTMAREILDNVSSVVTRSGAKVPLNMARHAISFSAHADYQQTREFLDALQPPHVVLVHGEKEGMNKLKNELSKQAAHMSLTRQVYTPAVGQTVQIKFNLEHAATMVGKLAVKPPREGQSVRGLLLRKGFENVVLHPDDLPHYTKILTGHMVHKQALQLRRPFSDVRLALEVMFEGTEGQGHIPVTSASDGKGDGEAVMVAGVVTVIHKKADPVIGCEDHVVVQWEGSSVADMVADAVVAVVLQSAGEPLAMGPAEEARRVAVQHGDDAAVSGAELQIVCALLAAQFGPSSVNHETGTIHVEVDRVEAVVDYFGNQVLTEDEHLRGRMEKSLLRIAQAMGPCSRDFDE